MKIDELVKNLEFVTLAFSLIFTFVSWFLSHSIGVVASRFNNSNRLFNQGDFVYEI